MSRGLLTINVVNYEDFSPIENAKITIYYIQPDTNETVLLCKNLTTNQSGQIRKIGLYAPNEIYTQMPSNKRPYSRYKVVVSKQGYEEATISGIQVLASQESIQLIRLNKIGKQKKPGTPTTIDIGDNVLIGNYPPKEIEEEVDSAPYILERVVVPEYIVVHDGLPKDKSAPDYWIYFTDYIKNVASSEIYSTWPTNTIYANVIAIISFTLNRVYTEWYKNQGYRFTITSTTQFDHKFIYGRNTFYSIDKVVDDIFNNYLKRDDQRVPLLAQYCDGKNSQCPGVMTQWGSKYLGDQGYSYQEILRYYYGDDITFNKAPVISGIATSYPGYTLEVGSRGEEVRTVQSYLNSISKSYPSIPKLDEDGIYGSRTRISVETFQKIFNLPRTGTVDFATWYEISRVYVAVNKLGEYQR